MSNAASPFGQFLRFPGEQRELDVVDAVGAAWGYGNLIEYLLERWQERDEAHRRELGVPVVPHFALGRKVAMGEVAAEELRRIARSSRG